MFEILKKLLRSEGGWISGAMMLGSMIGNGIMNSKKGKALGASGLEMANRDYVQTLENERLANNKRRGEMQGIMDQERGAAMPGLMGALPETFSMKPNSGEYDAIARQEQNLKNQALNSGARGGLLKKQMFEAAKNAASNKLSVMENARQNALQRAFGVFSGVNPNNQTDVAGQQISLGERGLGASNSQFDVNTELKRKIPAQAQGAANAAADAGGVGSGLGSILGGLDLTKLFGGGGGFNTAFSNTAPYSMPILDPSTTTFSMA